MDYGIFFSLLSRGVIVFHLVTREQGAKKISQNNITVDYMDIQLVLMFTDLIKFSMFSYHLQKHHHHLDFFFFLRWCQIQSGILESHSQIHQLEFIVHTKKKIYIKSVYHWKWFGIIQKASTVKCIKCYFISTLAHNNFDSYRPVSFINA